MSRRVRAAALVALAIGGVLLAIVGTRDSIAEIINLPKSSYRVCLISGLVLAVGGLLAFIASFIVESVGSQVTRVVYGDMDSRYVCTPASRTDLPGLYNLYAEYFGADVPPVVLMEAWIERCANSFTLIHRISQESGLSTAQKLVGSFKLLPLTQKGTTAIELGQVTGSTFKTEHICHKNGTTAAYYVGDVVATTPFARAVVIAQLNVACSGLAKSASWLYARPLTKDGRRIMTKHGFVQVSDGVSAPEIGRICKLAIAHGNGPERLAGGQQPAKTGRRRLTPLKDAP